MASQPEVPTPWIGIEELPVHFANAFGVLPAPNAIFLMFGSVMPLGGDDEGQVYAPVRPIARMAVAPRAVPGIIQALETALQQRDALEQSGNQ